MNTFRDNIRPLTVHAIILSVSQIYLAWDIVSNWPLHTASCKLHELHDDIRSSNVSCNLSLCITDLYIVDYIIDRRLETAICESF